MKANPEIVRQSLGCAYAPTTDLVPIQPWRPAEGYRGPEPTVCPNYTTNLPEVIEAARAWFHWEKGQLEHFTGTSARNTTDRLLENIEQMATAVSEITQAAQTKKDG